ncbi:hypothetical protein GGR22_003236 [Flavobacterium gossypii]|uniref:CBS domain-containing protein n=1 Tax=Flavobacterium gossypii TaxID=1646119 RepID=A0ABR6DUB7_9FLAO|nr:hypothetical protein [Flavobacterium gossypii]MBA9075059.1 hypothetical protein [Flavobacterium gossypii]
MYFKKPLIEKALEKRQLLLKDISLNLGDFVITFGLVESAIQALILSIVNVAMEYNDVDHRVINLLRILLNKSDSVDFSIQTLNSTIEIFIRDKRQDKWKEMVNELYQLNQYRNKVVHRPWMVQDDKVIKYNKKTLLPVEMSLEELLKMTERLKFRKDQITDFLTYTMNIINPDFIYVPLVNDEDRLLGIEVILEKNSKGRIINM